MDAVHISQMLYFTSFRLVKLLKGRMRPCRLSSTLLSYFGLTPHVSLLDAFQKTTFACQPRPKATLLSLFYRYYHHHYTQALGHCVPPSVTWPHSTVLLELLTLTIHKYCVFIAVFSFYSTCCPWNVLSHCHLTLPTPVTSFVLQKTSIYHCTDDG